MGGGVSAGAASTAGEPFVADADGGLTSGDDEGARYRAARLLLLTDDETAALGALAPAALAALVARLQAGALVTKVHASGNAARRVLAVAPDGASVSYASAAKPRAATTWPFARVDRLQRGLTTAALARAAAAGLGGGGGGGAGGRGGAADEPRGAGAGAGGVVAWGAPGPLSHHSRGGGSSSSSSTAAGGAGLPSSSPPPPPPPPLRDAPRRALSLVAAGGRGLDVVFDSHEEADAWATGLAALLLASRLGAETSDDRWLRRAFAGAAASGGPDARITRAAAAALLRRLGVAPPPPAGAGAAAGAAGAALRAAPSPLPPPPLLPPLLLAPPPHEAASSGIAGGESLPGAATLDSLAPPSSSLSAVAGGDGGLSLPAFLRLVDAARDRPEADAIFSRLAGGPGADALPAAALAAWLSAPPEAGGQGEGSASGAAALAARLAPPGGGGAAVSRAAFVAWLSGPGNAAFDPAAERVAAHAMHRPLAEYFVDSSHNTYLEGPQVAGGASVAPYLAAMQRGVRCVELDVWDGPGAGGGAPEVRHGPRGLTGAVPLAAVAAALSAHAFTTSPFPLILSLEVHASRDGQERVAAELVAAFGGRLLRPPPARRGAAPEPALPSPHALRGRVLVKAKLKRDGGLPSREEADGAGEGGGGGGGGRDAGGGAVEAVGLTGCLPFGSGPSAGTGAGAGAGAGAVTASAAPAAMGSPPPHAPRPPSPGDALAAPGRPPPSPPPPHAASRETLLAPALAALVALPTFKLASSGGGGGGAPLPGSLPGAPPGGLPPSAMASVKESKAARLLGAPGGPARVAAATATALVRVYPDGVRLGSSNFAPAPFWAAGVQAVALNYQTHDAGARLARAFFRQNGRCGYVLKPAHLRAGVLPPLPAGAAGGGGGWGGAWGGGAPPASPAALVGDDGARPPPLAPALSTRSVTEDSAFAAASAGAGGGSAGASRRSSTAASAAAAAGGGAASRPGSAGAGASVGVGVGAGAGAGAIAARAPHPSPPARTIESLVRRLGRAWALGGGSGGGGAGAHAPVVGQERSAPASPGGAAALAPVSPAAIAPAPSPTPSNVSLLPPPTAPPALSPPPLPPPAPATALLLDDARGGDARPLTLRLSLLGASHLTWRAGGGAPWPVVVFSIAGDAADAARARSPPARPGGRAPGAVPAWTWGDAGRPDAPGGGGAPFSFRVARPATALLYVEVFDAIDAGGPGGLADAAAGGRGGHGHAEGLALPSSSSLSGRPAGSSGAAAGEGAPDVPAAPPAASSAPAPAVAAQTAPPAAPYAGRLAPLSYAAVPLRALRVGARSLALRGPGGKKVPLCSLLVRFTRAPWA